MKLNLSTKTILIIEDYAMMRKSMKDMLYTLGAQYLFEAENGSAAIAALHTTKTAQGFIKIDNGSSLGGARFRLFLP